MVSSKKRRSSTEEEEDNNSSHNSDYDQKHLAMSAFLSKWIYEKVESNPSKTTTPSTTAFASPVAAVSHHPPISIQIGCFLSRLFYGSAENVSNASFDSPLTTTAISTPTTLKTPPPLTTTTLTTTTDPTTTFAGPVSVGRHLSEEYIQYTDEYRNKLCTFAILSSTEAVYLVFRGSVTPMDFLSDVSLSPEKLGDYWITSSHYAILKTVADTILLQLDKVIAKNITITKLYVTGHSLGGALAQLFGYLWKTNLYAVASDAAKSKLNMKVYSLASPLIRWQMLEEHEIDYLKKHNQDPKKVKFTVPESMYRRCNQPPLDYIINFVYNKDIIPRYPFGTKCRWSLENCFTQYETTKICDPFLQLITKSYVNTVAKTVSHKSPDISVGYLPLGRTFLFGPIFGSGNEFIEATNHQWFMKEYQRNQKLEVDHHGWNIEDHSFTSENGYKSLFTTTRKFVKEHSDEHMSKKRKL